MTEPGMKPPPDHSWLEVECVCCGLPEHVSWWRRLLPPPPPWAGHIHHPTFPDNWDPPSAALITEPDPTRDRHRAFLHDHPAPILPDPSGPPERR